MLLPVGLAVGLVAWSVVANLVIGDALYLVRNLALTAGLLLAARTAGLGWGELGLGRDRLRHGWWWGGGAALVVAAAVAAGAAAADAVPGIGALLADRRADLPPAEVAYQALVRIPLGTALFEEVAFRGLLLAALLRVASTGWAVAWSSAAFGLWHVASTMVTLEINDIAVTSGAGVAAIVAAVVVTTAAGVVFCLLRLVAGSLLAPTLAHWATNACGLVVAAATRSAAV